MIKRDIGDFTTDDDGERDGKELVATIRQSLAGLWAHVGGKLLDVSGTNSLSASVEVTQGFTALTNGLTAVLVPSQTNTGAVEINVAGLGLKAIKTSSGQALEPGTLIGGSRVQIVFDSDEDHWWVNGSSGTTNVTVTGGLQLKRSEAGRLAESIGPTVDASALVSRSFQCTYSTSRVIVEGAISRHVAAGITDPAGLEIQLYKDNGLLETIADGLVGDSQVTVPFYFSHLPGDTDAHTYEVRVSSTLAATYFASSTFIVASEMSPN